MRPEFKSRRLLGITRAKGKMYELGLPEEAHIAIPEGVEPAALFLMTVGTLVDVASEVNDSAQQEEGVAAETIEEIGFAASFFDAFLASRFWEERSPDVTLLASAAYYLGNRPGSSYVLAKRLAPAEEEVATNRLARWVLRGDWPEQPDLAHPHFGDLLNELAGHLNRHFTEGAGTGEVNGILSRVLARAYHGAPAHDLVMAEVASALIRLRLASSAWLLLPKFTGLAASAWSAVIKRQGFPKELWPSQKLLGDAGLFSGTSGVVQMPTSAGKTRSVEIILRSAFMSGRARLAVVVAPFRALSHEIAASLQQSFKGEDVKVNEVSDALQMDLSAQIAELFGGEAPQTKYILTLTPEKLLYVLRQEPALVNQIGVVVYDEGHQFDSGSRGITYELLLTEIKGLLTAQAQTVLVSAVIKNAEAVSQWLMGDDAKVVNGTGLLATARSVAFATWIEKLGQLMFFESGGFQKPDYFVPRVIEAQELILRARERVERVFPARGDSAWKDVSLYLGIRLAPEGAVAVFCGRKDTASGLAERAVEVYERGFTLPCPGEFSSPEEIRRLAHLASSHFGVESIVARAANLGIFVHHGTTPQGLRVAIEHAMQRELIKLVVCTSTLAQGINLPIRYLIVSGINQGAEQIKTRDFQNLIGRAGRAGMHTEGLILFADPRVYDRRHGQRWRMNAAAELLNPENAEDTTSSMLELIAPITGGDGATHLPIEVSELLTLYFVSEADRREWAKNTSERFEALGFSARDLMRHFT